ncbi:MAG: PEGA domain-containing protein [Candidatus Sulfotelmatobacter sp.]
MSKIGHFEILSELSKSATGAVYKANDAQTGQTIALKAIQLSAFGESAGELEKCLLEEAETTKVLSNPNLTTVSGAGVMEGQFCAAMEYVQGNSVATMLARKEGFSIWDLLDIGRQVCGGLDQAHSQNVFHYSLEPAKIMCGWDGTVRVLGFGVSSVGKFIAQMPDVPCILHYMSPEQIRGESIDARSNLFSLGALFYEMVTDHKAFEGENSESLRQSILESTPVPPVQVNPKLHPVLSDLIMRALAKDPNERYQNGRALLDELEKCKESKPQAAKTTAAPAKVPAVAAPAKAAAQPKFASTSPTPAQKKPVASPSPAVSKPTPQPPALRAAAAAAGLGGGRSASSAPNAEASNAYAAPQIKATGNAAPPSASMSSAILDEPEVEAPSAEPPRISVDPMMTENAPSRGSGGVSFSEMTELPPLKEVYIAPPPPPPAFQQPPSPAPNLRSGGEDEKPKIQPREVAEKAIKEIKNVPPSLMVYSIAGAAVVILIIAIALVLHINHLNSDDDSGRAVPPQPAAQPVASQTAAPAQPQQTTAPQPVAPEQTQPADVVETQPTTAGSAAVAATARGRKNAKKKNVSPVAAIVVPGQIAIDSTPQGAQVQLDGKTDPTWVTPFTLSGLTAGQHTVTVSKPGYSSDTRTVAIASGNKSFLVTHLTQLMATLSVTSTPPGAGVYIDGRDTGKLTPAQVSVDKGQHVVLVRKAGFIDETTNAQFVLAQTVSFSPTLRSLGNVDDIKTVGKMGKLFGGKQAQGMGTVSIKTQPKGAQIAVNKHMLDKSSPVDVMLDPGNYIVDITLTGYAPVHKVITVDKGGKAVIDEVLQHE